MNTRILSALAVCVLVMIFGAFGIDAFIHNDFIKAGGELLTAAIWLVLLLLVIRIEDGRK